MSDLLDNISGIPSHPLFVHAPVVLVPMVGIGALILAFRPAWRATIGWWLVGGAAVALVATLLAVGSGEALDERLEGLVNTDRHKEPALTTRALFITFFGATIAHTWLDRRVSSDGALRFAKTGAAVAVVATALLSVWWMYLTGEEGARITWSGIID